jgi:glycosyltransferase involved in cell wall biosynthesis
MTGRAIEVVAPGPCPRDPYDPAAPAWALAAGFAVGGDVVQVLYPDGPDPADAPHGVTAIALDFPHRRPGAPVEAVALSEAAGRRIRPNAEIVVRDPFGLGRIGPSRRRVDSPEVVGVVRGLELLAYDRERAGQPAAGLLDRMDHWRDRRAVRRLEQAALDEAGRLVYDAPDLPEILEREYGISGGRLRSAPPPVLSPAKSPTREQARRELHLPLDVPVVAAPLSRLDPLASGADRAREAFRRMRSLFAGARLVVIGTTGPSEPGVTFLADRDVATFQRALVAADVALFAPTTEGFDPGVVLAMRALCPVIVGSTVRFPVDPAGAVHRVPSDDPAELAAGLAEMLADPAERRDLSRAGARFAVEFDPDRVARSVLGDPGPD